MTFASTRSGKGVGLVIPTLLSWPHSTVVHDIKGENWQVTSGHRSTFSHCLLFDPTNLHRQNTTHFWKYAKAAMKSAMFKICWYSCRSWRRAWTPFPLGEDRACLTCRGILHILYAEEEKTLARVASFLSDPARSFETTLRAMMSTNHLGCDDASTPEVHPVVTQASRELLNKSENERFGGLSTAMSFWDCIETYRGRGDLFMWLADWRPYQRRKACFALPRGSLIRHIPDKTARSPYTQSDLADVWLKSSMATLTAMRDAKSCFCWMNFRLWDAWSFLKARLPSWQDTVFAPSSLPKALIRLKRLTGQIIPSSTISSMWISQQIGL